MMFSGRCSFLQGSESAVFSITAQESQWVQFATSSELKDTGESHGSHFSAFLTVARPRIHGVSI